MGRSFKGAATPRRPAWSRACLSLAGGPPPSTWSVPASQCCRGDHQAHPYRQARASCQIVTSGRDGAGSPSRCVPCVCSVLLQQQTMRVLRRTALDGILRIARYEGTAGLWRGTEMTLLISVPMIGLYLPLYDSLHTRLLDAGARSPAAHPRVLCGLCTVCAHTVLSGPACGMLSACRCGRAPAVPAGADGAAPLLAGAAARTAAVLAISPAELLKTRLQGLPHARARSGAPPVTYAGRLAHVWRQLQAESPVRRRLAARQLSGACSGCQGLVGSRAGVVHAPGTRGAGTRAPGTQPCTVAHMCTSACARRGPLEPLGVELLRAHSFVLALRCLFTRFQGTAFHPHRPRRRAHAGRLPARPDSRARPAQAGPLGRVRVLWRGVGLTLAKDVPYAVIFWSVLEPARAALLPPPADGAPAPSTSALLAANAAAGMASGGLAAALTTPLDVAKARARRLRVGWSGLG